MYEIVKTPLGHSTIRHTVLGETIHPSGPAQEAETTYVQQSLLEKKLLEKNPEELVLYDVGLGGAANSSAALSCWNQLKTRDLMPRALHIYSFENDISILDFALKNIDSFPHLHKNYEILNILYKEKIYEAPQLRWEILEGEFHDFLLSPLASSQLPEADVIFYDPYSPLKNPSMWNLATFAKLYEKSNDNCTLITYSQSTKVRAGLIASGYFVGHGMGLGMKRESTVASKNIRNLAKPLDDSWLEKWGKSEAPFPTDVPEIKQTDFKAQLEKSFSLAKSLRADLSINKCQ